MYQKTDKDAEQQTVTTVYQEGRVMVYLCAFILTCACFALGKAIFGS